ncbi:MAG: glycosyltransferase, partial [Verrucomicrobiota bacterium]|nr:glycosyltransferase [Verrucomicrobiota bacterium]
LGYLGTYSDDRQPTVDRLLLQPAAKLPTQRFVVAGPQYPDSIPWPKNVEHITHLEPKKHRAFYNAQRFTLNVTRADMIRAGFSPSVRLFEAAACGTPIVSDEWPGLSEFFTPGEEILIARSTEDMLEILREMSDSDARAVGERARERVLAAHTAAHRAAELEGFIEECRHQYAENGSVCVTKE